MFSPFYTREEMDQSSMLSNSWHWQPHVYSAGPYGSVKTVKGRVQSDVCNDWFEVKWRGRVHDFVDRSGKVVEGAATAVKKRFVRAILSRVRDVLKPMRIDSKRTRWDQFLMLVAHHTLTHEPPLAVMFERPTLVGAGLVAWGEVCIDLGDESLPKSQARKVAEYMVECMKKMYLNTPHVPGQHGAMGEIDLDDFSPDEMRSLVVHECVSLCKKRLLRDQLLLEQIFVKHVESMPLV